MSIFAMLCFFVSGGVRQGIILDYEVAKRATR